jgi:prephenate dehydratase
MSVCPLMTGRQFVVWKTDQAVMAIENSIAGPIIPNYALIDKNNSHNRSIMFEFTKT